MKHGEEPTVVAILANGTQGYVLRQTIKVLDIGRTGGGKVAVLRVIRAFCVIQLLNQLGNQEIEIGVTLAVGMGRKVYWHPIKIRRKIGSVIEVKTSQEILVRFTSSGMLSDDNTGDSLQDFTRTENRTLRNLLLPNGSLGRRAADADQAIFPTDNDDGR